MASPGSRMWAWALCVFLSCTSCIRVEAAPQYMVAVPAVLEAAGESKFCVSLLDPNETLTVTVSLKSKELNSTLMQMESVEDFHLCREFEVPVVEKEEVMALEVVVQGDTFYSRESRKVLIKSYKPTPFIQTDKPIYLPGQLVQFRVISLDSMLKPSALLFNLIEVQDPNGNRIAQWLDHTTENKILQLSYKLSSEATEGQYLIRVETGPESHNQWFKVEKYVLPKFEVTVTSESEVNIEQEEFKVQVCAKYTYQQPVPGRAVAEVCRSLNPYLFGRNEPRPEVEEPCDKQMKQTDATGCADFTFLMSTFTKLDNKVTRDQLRVTATVEEEGTGVSLSQRKMMDISYILGTLSFIDTPTVYMEGSIVEGKVKGVYYNDTPMANTPIFLFKGKVWSSCRLQNLTTDSNGIATFSFSTETIKGNLELQASVKPELKYNPYRTPYYQDAEHLVSVFQDPSQDTEIFSTLEVKAKTADLECRIEERFTISYTVVGEKEGKADLMYLVLSRGIIISQGNKKLKIANTRVTKGVLTISVMISPDMAPSLQVVVYAVLPSGGVVANSAEFTTEKCFSQKVSLEFSDSSAVPGEQLTMKLKAQPDALCGVSAVDRSVYIKEPVRSLTADSILSLLPNKRYMPYQIEDPFPCVSVRLRRSILPIPEGKDDPFMVFQNNGLKMVTNILIRMPSCLSFRGRNYHFGMRGYSHHPMVAYEMAPPIARLEEGSEGGPAMGMDVLPPLVTVRTFFPETWLWDLYETGGSGEVDTVVNVPDTITTWETDAFCLSSQGFGLAPRTDLTVFQPFFLELSLPYSIIRGEQFELKATVFNYLAKCIMLTVTPADSPDYKLVPLSGDKYTSCLCGNERRTVSWTMLPSALGVVEVTVSAEAVASHVSCNNEVVLVPPRGRIDVVKRTLIVKAEGIEMSLAYNWLLCPEDQRGPPVPRRGFLPHVASVASLSPGKELKEELTIVFPKDLILGSARGTVSVLGDIMGRALKNLDGLLRMPYGCGEQNMAVLAPNIYILQYLEKTNQLTPEVREKAVGFLSTGYQRQLNYRHSDGAYSTFGSGNGNSWLTAFVLRSFTKAAQYTFVDQSKMDQTRDWLIGKQQENGCFQMVGTLFHNRMKGGVSDEVTFTAYIIASFLEMNMPANELTLKNGLSCLKASIEKDGLPNTYTTALMAYAFTLAGDSETRTRLLDQLRMEAKTTGGFLYWEQESGTYSMSLSVEISSYVILAKLSSNPTNEDLGYATAIVRWLTTQQNYYGGFSSTQDTVVALQALALYSTLVFSPDGSTEVAVASPSVTYNFMVNKDNKLLYQERELEGVEEHYVVTASGSGCAAVQIAVYYNVPTPVQVSTFELKALVSADCPSRTSRVTVKVEIEARYTGRDNSSNMVILEIKILSGFEPDNEFLEVLRGPDMNRVEHNKDQVLVYIPEMTKEKVITYSVGLVQELQVTGLKPAVIKLYDYYEPSNKAETEYTYPCKA